MGRVNTFLSIWWERLSSSYWFIPSLMVSTATGLSFLTVHLDTLVEAKWARAAGWLWAGGPEGARSVLATIAGSTITVAGVVFSITIVALTLASSQFGPRLLRNFMNDRGTQIVLGVFVSTFLYCLLILRTIRGTDAVSFVPFLSVTLGLLFGVTSVGFLIYFIHHVPTSILAETVIGRVARDLQAGIDKLYPEKSDNSAGAGELPPQFEREARPFPSRQSGFLQAIANEELVELASRENLIIRLRRRPGDFVAEGATLAEGWPGDQITDETMEKFEESVFYGWHRTPPQDIEFAIDQLVEVAVRALSPGINDPFTAITCIEWLGVALIRVGSRQIPSPHLHDAGGQLRLVTDTTSFAGIAAASLNQIRQNGCKTVAVVVRLLDVIARVAVQLPRTEDRVTMLGHAEAVRDDGLAATANERDRQDIEEHFAVARRALTASDR